MTVLLIIFIFLVIIGLTSGMLMFWSLNKPKKNNTATPLPFLSIIIPARDEEKRLPALLQSLQKQTYAHYEVMVVDDGSTDQTVSVATNYGAKAIPNKPVHHMTAGKSAACATGAEQAKGDWLLFLDADVQFDTESSLEELLLAFQEKGGKGIFSVQPYHQIEAVYENFSAVFNIIVMTGVNVFTFWKDKFKTAGSFGPVILCKKDEYERTGGHHAAAESIMDDFALSSLFTARGLPVKNDAGKGLVTLRMYPGGMKELIEGWTKNLATASQSTHGFVMLLICLWINGAIFASVLPAFALFSGTTGWVGISLLLYTVYALHVLMLGRRTGNFHWWVFFLFPVLFLFFTAVYVYSLYCTHVLRTVSWRGRKIKV